MNTEKLIEDKGLREKHISRVEVLDKVKVLSMLPDGMHLSTKQVAEYYEVNKVTIDVMMKRHRDEFKKDGIRILKGYELKQYKATHLHAVSELKRVPALTLFPRRAILRVGMLLEKSEVAKKIRDYLLNVEEKTTNETKRKITDNNKSSNENIIILNCVLSSLSNNGTLQHGFEEAGKKIDMNPNTVASRWRNNIKKTVDESVINTIKNSQITQNKNIIEFDNGQDFVEILNNKFDDAIRENIELNKENFNLQDENKRLKKNYKKMKEEYSILMNVIGRALKHHTKEELKFSVGKDGLVNMNK